jgi:hypothetical protein
MGVEFAIYNVPLSVASRYGHGLWAERRGGDEGAMLEGVREGPARRGGGGNLGSNRRTEGVSCRLISCSVREAIYVLDRLLENETVLRPREHTTDAHGYTEQLFRRCPPPRSLRRLNSGSARNCR